MAALVGIAAHLGAIFAAHVPLQLVDWRRLGPAHDVQRDRLMRVATEAPDLKIPVAGVQRVTERRRGLRGSLVAQHALVPGLAGELVGFLPRLTGALGRGPYGSAVDPLA